VTLRYHGTASLTTTQAIYGPDSDTYGQFLSILQEYYLAMGADTPQDERAPEDNDQGRNARIMGTIDGIKKLFEGQDELIQGLDTFIPDRYKKKS
jgi:hypothetical protein